MSKHHVSLYDDIDSVVDFIKSNGMYPCVSRNAIKDIIKKHLDYGTAMIIYDDKGICAVARWNWIGMTTAHILDVVIRKDVRSLGSLKSLLYIGVKHNPRCKHIIFERGKKYPNRNTREYFVEDFLKRRNK